MGFRLTRSRDIVYDQAGGRGTLGLRPMTNGPKRYASEFDSRLRLVSLDWGLGQGTEKGFS